MNLEAHIEAVLFYRAEPMKKKDLAAFFDVNETELAEALVRLSERLTGGVSLILTDDAVTLGTAPEVSETITRLRKDELSRDIGKAGAETLAIVLYRGPLTRAEIDLIRGVNSTFILRNLLMRGLVERVTHPSDKRQFQYMVTPELLAHLGIRKKEELPEYQRIADELDTYEREQRTEEGRETATHVPQNEM